MEEITITRHIKTQLNLIRPEMTNGCKAWTLINSDENMLKEFKRKIRRKTNLRQHRDMVNTKEL